MPVEPSPTQWQFTEADSWELGFDVVAIGADLEPGTVLAAYRRGMFPMHLSTGELGWWSPDPRGVLPLDSFHVSRSLGRSMRRFTMTIDSCFEDVMRACADRPDAEGWITEEFVGTYGHLHRLGWAHSVEVWDEDARLVGGLYGLEIGGLFAGESMFHRTTDASKAALAGLVEIMLGAGDGSSRLLDVQWCTEHLATLGAIEIPRPRYLERLGRALELDPAF